MKRKKSGTRPMSAIVGFTQPKQQHQQQFQHHNQMQPFHQKQANFSFQEYICKQSFYGRCVACCFHPSEFKNLFKQAIKLVDQKELDQIDDRMKNPNISLQKPKSKGTTLPVHPQSAKTTINHSISHNNDNDRFYESPSQQYIPHPIQSSRRSDKIQNHPMTTIGTTSLPGNVLLRKNPSSGIIQNPFSEADNLNTLKKLIPKSIKKTNEMLYQGVLDVKVQCNKYEQENVKLKTQVAQVQKQNMKLQKLLFEIDEQQQTGQINPISKPAADNLLIITLKREQKQLQQDLADREEEIKQMRLSVKHSRTMELEIQLQTYIEETLRLKVKLDQFSRQKQRQEKQEQLMIYDEDYDNLIDQNTQLRSIVAQLNSNIEELESRKEVDNRLFLRSTEIDQLRTQIIQKDSHIHSIESQLAQKSEVLRRANSQLSDYQRIEASIKENRNQERQLTRKIEETESRNREQAFQIDKLQLLNQDLTEKLDRLNSENKRLRQERDHQVSQGNRQPFSEYPQQVQHENSRQGDVPIQQSNTATTNGYKLTLGELAFEKEIQERLNGKRQSFKTTVPITTEEVTHLGLLLNNRLSVSKISLDAFISELVFTEHILNKGRISIQDFVTVLSNDVIKFSEEDSVKFARYVIEDNNENTIQLRMTTDADNSIVKSRLKYIIGQVQILSPEEQIDMEHQLSEILKKHGNNLRAQLLLIASMKKETTIKRENLINAMNYVDMVLTKPQSEYYFQSLTTKSMDPFTFFIDDCTELFM